MIKVEDLDPLERVHLYLINQWLRALINDDFATTAWYREACFFTETLIPDKEITTSRFEKFIEWLRTQVGA